MAHVIILYCTAHTGLNCPKLCRVVLPINIQWKVFKVQLVRRKWIHYSSIAFLFLFWAQPQNVHRPFLADLRPLWDVCNSLPDFSWLESVHVHVGSDNVLQLIQGLGQMSRFTNMVPLNVRSQFLPFLSSSNSTPNSISTHPPYYFSKLQNQINKQLPYKLKGRELDPSGRDS